MQASITPGFFLDIAKKTRAKKPQVCRKLKVILAKKLKLLFIWAKLFKTSIIRRKFFMPVMKTRKICLKTQFLLPKKLTILWKTQRKLLKNDQKLNQSVKLKEFFWETQQNLIKNSMYRRTWPLASSQHTSKKKPVLWSPMEWLYFHVRGPKTAL